MPYHYILFSSCMLLSILTTDLLYLSCDPSILERFSWALKFWYIGCCPYGTALSDPCRACPWSQTVDLPGFSSLDRNASSQGHAFKSQVYIMPSPNARLTHSMIDGLALSHRALTVWLGCAALHTGAPGLH